MPKKSSSLPAMCAAERLVGELAPELVPMLASLQQPANFVPLTNAVLRELAMRGIGIEKVDQVLQQMALELPSASKAFLEWAAGQNVDVRIISDCNSHFIGKILQGPPCLPLPSLTESRTFKIWTKFLRLAKQSDHRSASESCTYLLLQ